MLKEGVFKNDLKTIFDASETSDGLSKENYDIAKKRLDPLWNEVVNTTNANMIALEGSDDAKGDAIEDVKMHLELIELKWERFLALEIEIDRKISDMEKATVIVEKNSM